MAAKIRQRLRRAMPISPGEIDRRLPGLQQKEKIRILKAAVFTKDEPLRHLITNDLLLMGQFKFLVQMAKRMNRKMLPNGFFIPNFKYGEFPFSYGREGADFKRRFQESVKRGPAFKYRGFDVHAMEGLHCGAMLYFGKIYVDTAVPEQYRPVFCAHEVGEIFNHQIGIAMELLEVKKRGLEKDFFGQFSQFSVEEQRERSAIARQLGLESMSKEMSKITGSHPDAINGP